MSNGERLLVLAVLLPLYVVAVAIGFMAIESYVHMGDQMEMTVVPAPAAAQSMYQYNDSGSCVDAGGYWDYDRGCLKWGWWNKERPGFPKSGIIAESQSPGTEWDITDLQRAEKCAQHSPNGECCSNGDGVWRPTRLTKMGWECPDGND